MNNGMNKIASALICDCFTYAIAGIGTTTGDEVSSDYSTTATATVGGAVTLSGGTFTFDVVAPGDIGNIIKWESTGFEGRITAIADSTHCTITPNPSVGQSGNFVMYRTNWNILDNEVLRTNSYLATSPYCSTGLFGNTLVHQRTWDFPEEVGTVNYTEMGVGWTGTLNDVSDPLGGSVFARFLLHSVTAVNAGEQLRLMYQLRIVLSPTTDFGKSATISGWPLAPATDTQGDEKIQYLGMSSVATSGATQVYDAGQYSNEPSQTTNVGIWVSTNSTANAAFGATVDRYTAAAVSTSGQATSPTYSLNSYTKVKQYTFTAGEGNSTVLRSMGVGYNVPSTQAAKVNTLSFVFDQSQTKAVTNTLNLQFFYTWARVLSPSSV
ncbi:MAG: hypothetical protein ACYSUV_02015 [Planctomycetota bacterium]